MTTAESGVNRRAKAHPKASANRGPKAAAENHARILEAALRVFSEQGYSIPFSAIAKAAGVSQAVMYRHFSSKLDVALAVFEQNLTELEELAASSESDGFWRAWDRLVEMTIETSAFLEMVIDARHQIPDYDGTKRVETLIRTSLDSARRSGTAPAGVVVDDVVLTVRMVYGVVSMCIDPEDAPAAVERALGLVAWLKGRPVSGS